MLQWCRPRPTYVPRFIQHVRLHQILPRRELHAGTEKSVTQKAASSGARTCVTGRSSPVVIKGPSSEDVTSTAQDNVITQPLAAEDSALAAYTSLSDFLSQKPPTSSTKKPSLDTIRALYGSVKSQGQLRLFFPKQLTELISLYGTLSLPDTREGLIYSSKLAQHVTVGRTNKEQWDFVIEVARDKQTSLKMKLNGTDGFWLMRALLTKVVLAEGESFLSPDDPRKQALSEATQHYLRIWRHAYDVEIHLPLIQKWFDLGTKKDTETLVNRLCRVLEFHAYPNSRLLEVLWRVILRPTSPLVPPLKARILSMVNTRLSSEFASSHQEYSERRNRNPPPPPLISSESDSQAIRTPDLSNALGSALFPTYAPGTRPASPEVNHWAAEQARQAFGPDVALDVQWGNLLLLAIHQAKRLDLPAVSQPPPPPTSHTTEEAHESEEPVGDWRPVLMLTALERETSAQSPKTMAPSVREDVQEIVRPLWRSWKAGDDSTRLNSSSSRPILASFLRLAAKVVDGPLTDAIHRFCVKHDLFRRSESIAAEAAGNWADLNAAYVLAVAACRGVGWQTAFEETQISGKRDDVLSTLFHHYVLTDIRVGYQVYQYAEHWGYQLKEYPVYLMGIALAKPQSWQLIMPILERPAMFRQGREKILMAVLQILRTERQQYVEPAHAKVLGDALLKLYEHTAPSSQFKYPIRFFFSIMIASEQPALAITIVEAIQRNAPQSFFTTRLYLRLMRTLVRHRYFKLTHRVHKLVSTDPADARAAADFRRKLTLSLARAGASRAAKRAYSFAVQPSSTGKVWRTPREALACVAMFNSRSPSYKKLLTILYILNRARKHAPTIQYAITLLIRGGHVSTARRVLKRSLPYLDTKNVTTIGNTFLDNLLRRHGLRNGRLVRHTLRVREQLERDFGFKPDRVTINIIVSGILRWRQVLDAKKIRGLFDHMVRCGYPASEERRRPSGGYRDRGDLGVPFGTSAASFRISLLTVKEEISFERHVRPLYKMFVKALHARGDRAGARTVLGILKEEEIRTIRARQAHNQARAAGIVKKNAAGGRSRQ